MTTDSNRASFTIVRHWPDRKALGRIEEEAASSYLKVGYDALSWAVNVPEEANGLLWVAVLDGEPVGFAICDIFHTALHLEEIDVVPPHQGKGIGKALVKAVIEEARRRRMPMVSLRTFLTTPWSIELYRKEGFQVVKESEAPWYIPFHCRTESKIGFPIEDRCTMTLVL
jgi:GNAT superfamily N-acetyltransferase